MPVQETCNVVPPPLTHKQLRPWMGGQIAQALSPRNVYFYNRNNSDRIIESRMCPALYTEDEATRLLCWFIKKGGSEDFAAAVKEFEAGIFTFTASPESQATV